MQLPNMQPMPQSNQTPSPAPMGGLQTIAPQSAAPQINTPAPPAQSPYPAPPTAPFASSGAPPSSINPGAQPPVVQQLSQQGRYGDSTLVHMNAEEVGGLQALAQSQGGSLTINPQTGLPEAFSLGGFLKGLLPTIIGMVAAPLSGGLINPMTMGALVGAGKVATGGSLKEGLMAGLGAAGGMGIGSSLMSAGTAAGAAPVTGLGSGLQAMGSGLKNIVTGGPLMGTAATTATPLAGDAAMGANAVAHAATPGVLGRVGTALHNAEQAAIPTTGPGSALAAAHPGIAANLGRAAVLNSATSALTSGLTPPSVGGGPSSLQYVDPYLGPYSFSGAEAVFPGEGRTGTSEFNYFPDRKIGSAYVTPDPKAIEAFLAQDANANRKLPFGLSGGKNTMTGPQRRLLEQQQAHVRQFGYAKGGVDLENGAFIVDARTVSELGNGSSRAGQELLAKQGGQPIHGKGDGVSDSIHANIGGRQDARVARDEVKFSPQAVAKLGGGSQQRGAKKLYAMMDRAAKARKAADRGEDTGLRGLMAIR